MVYVDDATWEWRGQLWCHLLADSIEELHTFARCLGLRRTWFQSSSKFPHYDLTANKRLQAIRLGAQAVDVRSAIMRARTLRTSTAVSYPVQTELQWG
jgi:hypothetical protein